MLNGIDDRYEKTNGYPYPVVFFLPVFWYVHWLKEKAILD
jgi:hypothetical protein